MTDYGQNKLKVKWVDSGFWATLDPNPDHLKGIDMDVSRGSSVTCETKLPYPAQRCGFYEVTCEVCGLRVAVTTAGRADDPRSVKVACKIKRN